MEYVRPTAEKLEGGKPPISANFAPPPVEQLAVTPTERPEGDELESEDGPSDQDCTPPP